MERAPFKTLIARWAAWTQSRERPLSRRARLLLTTSPIALMLLLVACAQPTTTVAQAGIALTAADQVALSYVTLPACPSTNGALCSDPAVSAQIKHDAGAAYVAVRAAEASGNSADLAAANAAIAALTALVPASPAVK